MRFFDRCQRVATVLALALAGAGSTARAAVPLRVTPLTAAPASTYARGEWAVDVGRAYDNPFDPGQIAVDAIFTDAAGRTMRLPAFWRTAGDASGTFCVRFAPDKPGDWAMQVTAVDAGGARESAVLHFTVAASAEPGLVHVADNKRYFRYDNGQTYFPIGINLAWPPADARAEWYEKMFADMAGSGGNFARVWMAHPPVSIENDHTGLGRYDEKNAEYFDAVLDAAQRHGVRVMLCFLNHRELLVHDMWGPAGWPTNVYNAANGGPATRPFDFLNGDAAKKQFQARLRYIVARYASYAGLGMWELFNEQEFTPSPVPLSWDAEMAAYLTKTDPYGRMVSTSATVPAAVWRLPAMAFTQAHLYGDGNQADLVPSVTAAIADHAHYGKPHLIAEYGIDSAGDDNKFDPAGRGTAFHNSLWSAALGGAAGSSMYWWWDGYVWPKGLYRDFKPLADFVRPIDFARKQFEPLSIRDLKRTSATGRTVLVIPAAGGWGAKMHGVQTLPLNGRPDQAIPTFMVGPNHKEQYAPVELDLDLPAESKLTLRAGRVSDYCVLRVSVDGKAIEDVLFSATPGSAGIDGATWDAQGNGYRADVTAPRTLSAAIPAGKHRVTLDAVAGDWVTLGGVEFSDALDNHYANLAAVAVQDAASKETLAWVFDTRSTWKADKDAVTLDTKADTTVVIPKIADGTWSALWWDTRAAKPIRTDRVTPKDGVLTLPVPAFTQDVALRLSPVD